MNEYSSNKTIQNITKQINYHTNGLINSTECVAFIKRIVEQQFIESGMIDILERARTHNTMVRATLIDEPGVIEYYVIDICLEEGTCMIGTNQINFTDIETLNIA